MHKAKLISWILKAGRLRRLLLTAGYFKVTSVWTEPRGTGDGIQTTKQIATVFRFRMLMMIEFGKRLT